MTEWTGKEIDNIVQGIAKLGMLGREDLLEELKPSLEECTSKIDEVMSNKWFNEEMMKEWKKLKKPDIEAIK